MDYDKIVLYKYYINVFCLKIRVNSVTNRTKFVLIMCGERIKMIRLSRLTDYAVVILAQMAREKDGLLSAAELSRRTALTETTVSKILKLLARGGLIDSVRGMNGGYRLGKEAKELAINDIITAMEGPIALTACVEGSPDNCALEGVCALNGRWSEVNAAIKTALGKITLADMAGAG